MKAETVEYIFPWSVNLYVDEDGDTVATFTDAPPNIHFSAHGKDANEALAYLKEVVNLHHEMEAEKPNAT